MHWQYIIVALIGLIILGIVVSKLYRLFVPPSTPSQGGCDGCRACPSARTKETSQS